MDPFIHVLNKKIDISDDIKIIRILPTKKQYKMSNNHSDKNDNVIMYVTCMSSSNTYECIINGKDGIAHVAAPDNTSGLHYLIRTGKGYDIEFDIIIADRRARYATAKFENFCKFTVYRISEVI
jgi:hypothetical protein